jgi:hypothetical protein
MSIDSALVIEARRHVRNLIVARAPIEDALRSVVEACARRSPRDWSPFRWMNWTRSADEFAQRFEACIEIEPPGAEIDGLWIGLFNPVERSKTVLDCYLAGNFGFDANSVDWACGPRYWPEARYFEIPVLKEVYQLAHENTDRPGSAAEQALGEAFVASCASATIAELFPRSPSLNRRVFGVGYGFDSGDHLFLGRVTQGKFSLGTNDAPEWR